MPIILFASISLGLFVGVFSTLAYVDDHINEPKVYSCRPPVDQGERLVVTLYEKDGGLHEQCSYYPETTPKGSKDLKDWRNKL